MSRLATERSACVHPDRAARALWCGVILQAVADAKGGCKKAAHWLDRSEGQFVGLCEALELNPQAVREKAKQ